MKGTRRGTESHEIDAGQVSGPLHAGATVLRWLLPLPLLLLAIGRFLHGPLFWGVNHLAYLPGWVFPIWLLIAAGLLYLAWRPESGRWLAEPIPRFLYLRRLGPSILLVVAGGIFALLRERSYFMGDGYLIGELVEHGVPFRAFDNLDYLAHFQVYKQIMASGATVRSFDIYRAGSVLAGMLAVGTWLLLIRRLHWEPWRKAALAGLLFFMGPVALFHGYVESYSFLFVFVTAFLIAGVLVLEGGSGLWLAATFFGLGLAFHLTALFSAPALLYLALRAPARSWRKRWLMAAAPPAALLALAVAVHWAEGFNAMWFRREFLENQNTRNLWIPLAGGRGILSFYYWKDLANLACITAPAAMVTALSGLPAIRRRIRDPRIGFLLVQMASVLFFALALDRKLGGARDWDLLAAHAAGLVLLAAMLLPSHPAPPETSRTSRKEPAPQIRGAADGSQPHRLVPFILVVGFLAAAPWVVLLHWEQRSIARFVSVAADFPDFQRGYAYEEVGKYYRNANDLPQAEEMYKRAVAANPSHARLRVLLGAIFFTEDKIGEAEVQYREAYRMDPKNFMAIEMLGKVALKREEFPAALDWFRQLRELRPKEASSWELYGYCALRANRLEDGVSALTKAMSLDPKLHYRQDVGVALIRLRRYPEAVESFREALVREEDRRESHLGIAYARIEMARNAGPTGGAALPAWLDEAQEHLKILLARDPKDARARDLMAQLAHLRG